MQTQRQVAANPQTKPIDLGRESAGRKAAIIHIHHRPFIITQPKGQTHFTILLLLLKVLLTKFIFCRSVVVYCPPLPYWSETQFNSTDNDFLSVVTYWCNDGYAFKGHTSHPGNETVLSSMCIASKKWYPEIVDCYCTYTVITRFQRHTGLTRHF